MSDLAELDRLLSGPLLMDGHGALYELRPSTSGWQAEPNSSGDEPWLGFGDGASARWLSNVKELAVRDEESGAIAVKPLGEVRFGGSLPDYAAVFGVDGRDRLLLAVAGKTGTYCVDLRATEAREFMLESGYRFFSGWRGGDQWFLAGMKERQIDGDSITEWGSAALAILSEGKMRLKSLDVEMAPHLKKVRTIDLAGGSLQSYADWRVEACVDTVQLSSAALLVCALIPDQLTADADWFFGKEVRRADHHVFAIARYGEQGIEQVQSCIDAGQYLGQLPARRGQVQLMFLTHEQATDGTLPLLSVTLDEASGAILRTAAGKIDGVALGFQASSITMHHDSKIGFYGCLGLFTEGGQRYSLIVGDEGTEWRIAQTLCDYER